MDPLDGSVIVPPGEVPVHRGPRREVLRKLTPSAAGPHHVEDRIHDPSPRMLLPPPTLRAHPRWRQQRLDQRPLFIRQVRRIPTPSTAHNKLNDHISTATRQISNAVSVSRVPTTTVPSELRSGFQAHFLSDFHSHFPLER